VSEDGIMPQLPPLTEKEIEVFLKAFTTILGQSAEIVKTDPNFNKFTSGKISQLQFGVMVIERVGENLFYINTANHKSDQQNTPCTELPNKNGTFYLFGVKIAEFAI
jgi:hypothetical protein